MKIEKDKLKKYEQIIELPRPVSKKHIPMERSKRAAQFAPFSALTGYENAIMETEKKKEEKWEKEYDGL